MRPERKVSGSVQQPDFINIFHFGGKCIVECYFVIYPTFLIIGIFFVLPCIESYQKVDLRTITLGVPPQEVRKQSIGNFSVWLLNSNSNVRCWPRTAWRCRWTRWCTTGSATPPSASLTWRTPTTAPGKYLKWNIFFRPHKE